MPLSSDFEQSCVEVGRLRALIAQTEPNVIDPVAREQLRALAGDLDRQYADYVREFPKAIAATDASLADNKQAIVETRQALEQTKAQLAEAFQTAAAQQPSIPDVPTPELPIPLPVPFLPVAAPQLHQEMLDYFKFNRPKSGGAANDASLEIWQDWGTWND